MFEMCNFAVSKNSRRDEIRNLRKETFAGPKGKSAVTPRLVEPMGGVARYAPSNLGCVFVVLAKFVHASGSSPNELVRFAFFSSCSYARHRSLMASRMVGGRFAASKQHDRKSYIQLCAVWHAIRLPIRLSVGHFVQDINQYPAPCLCSRRAAEPMNHSIHPHRPNNSRYHLFTNHSR
jgi:hypothetical protein